MPARLVVSMSAAAVGAVLLVLAFWPAQAVGGSSATRDRTLRLNISDANIEFIDPALNYDFLGWRLATMTCARLLSYPPRDPCSVTGRCGRRCPTRSTARSSCASPV